MLKMDAHHAEMFKRRYQYLRYGCDYPHRIALVCAWMWGSRDNIEFRTRVLNWAGLKNMNKALRDTSIYIKTHRQQA